MTAAELKQSAKNNLPPEEMAPLVEAMWWAARGDWERAHAIAQDVESRDGAWVHGHLHRLEGDLGNAGYWYRQAGRGMPEASLEEEWAEVAAALLRGEG